ncbi:MAG TPA: hypothetical protein VH684_04305 [Xanthobacteraceae bacterium]|jgi:hypothetical protein
MAAKGLQELFDFTVRWRQERYCLRIVKRAGKNRDSLCAMMLSLLERAVLEKLLAGDCPRLGILRSQLRDVEVERREFTGIGFFIYFRVGKDIERLDGTGRFIFGDVQACISGLNYGAGFLLYVTDGALHMLEGYTYDEPWPRSIEQFELTYDNGLVRDLGKISRVFARIASPIDFSSIDWLFDKSNHGYGLLSIPQPRDEDIANLIRSWTALTESERKESAAHLSDKQSSTFLSFSERMASRAVRERNSEYLLLGLLALGIEGGKVDRRDNLLLMPLHYDASRRIGANPNEIFENVARLIPGTGGQNIRAFLSRSERDKSLDVMGYVVGADDDGFRYARTW